jgi:hypothetical protein
VSYLDPPPQGEVERAAQAFVRSHLRGAGKDRDAAKAVLLAQVSERHDPRSKAIKKILEAS